MLKGYSLSLLMMSFISGCGPTEQAKTKNSNQVSETKLTKPLEVHEARELAGRMIARWQENDAQALSTEASKNVLASKKPESFRVVLQEQLAQALYADSRDTRALPGGVTPQKRVAECFSAVNQKAKKGKIKLTHRLIEELPDQDYLEVLAALKENPAENPSFEAYVLNVNNSEKHKRLAGSVWYFSNFPVAARDAVFTSQGSSSQPVPEVIPPEITIRAQNFDFLGDTQLFLNNSWELDLSSSQWRQIKDSLNVLSDANTHLTDVVIRASSSTLRNTILDDIEKHEAVRNGLIMLEKELSGTFRCQPGIDNLHCVQLEGGTIPMVGGKLSLAGLSFKQLSGLRFLSLRDAILEEIKKMYPSKLIDKSAFIMDIDGTNLDGSSGPKSMYYATCVDKMKNAAKQNLEKKLTEDQLIEKYCGPSSGSAPSDAATYEPYKYVKPSLNFIKIEESTTPQKTCSSPGTSTPPSIQTKARIEYYSYTCDDLTNNNTTPPTFTVSTMNLGWKMHVWWNKAFVNGRTSCK